MTETIKYKDLFPKKYFYPERIAEELREQMNQALVHLQKGSELDVLEAIRILKK